MEPGRVGPGGKLQSLEAQTVAMVERDEMDAQKQWFIMFVPGKAKFFETDRQPAWRFEGESVK
jgi:hypothetical protein